jgi:hypothetical protein
MSGGSVSAAVYPQQSPSSASDEYSALLFVIQQMLSKLAGPTLVRVVACSNSGQVAPPGTVNVQPLVNQMSGNQQPQPHGIVYNLPYLRIQSGGMAIIMDPSIGDVGLACFASRDISAVKAFMQANPGASVPTTNPSSARTFDWADGLYLFGIFGTANIVQYIVSNAAGLNLVSPQQITLQAPTVNILTQTLNATATDQMSVTTPLAAFSDQVTVADDAVIGSSDYLQHTHTSESPGTPTSPPIV